MKATFIGLGYIGLPTAIIAAKHGIQVLGVDINPKIVESTNQGILHFIEPGLNAYLEDVINNKSLRASVTPEESDAFFIVVPTPFTGVHKPDVSFVDAATRSVIPFLSRAMLKSLNTTYTLYE